mgnify:FL=1
MCPASIVASYLLAFTWWLIMKSFKHTPTRKLLFWGGAPILTLAVLVSLSMALRRPAAPDSRPVLRFDINQLRAGDLLNENKESIGTYVSMVTTIVNTGEPTSISGYVLIAKVPTMQAPVLAKRPTIPVAGVQLGGEWLCGSDALDRRTQEPIPHGGQRQGRLLFTFQEVSTATLKTPGSTFNLIAIDAWGKGWTTEMPIVVPATKLELMNYPALQPQPQKSAPESSAPTNSASTNKPAAPMPVAEPCF